MNTIKTPFYNIYFSSEGFRALEEHLHSHSYSKIFVLVDSNTHQNCLSYFLSQFLSSHPFEIIEIPAGEAHKTMFTCLEVWRSLYELGADRKSLLLNLGGGVVTDLGGFVASTFKRGIAFINIPTTLLAMVDASVGGKTGVDLDLSKNQIGTITFSEMVVIDPTFLDTLPKNEMRSGLAEMLKHGLILNKSYWDQLKELKQLKLEDLNHLIHHSVALKNSIVTQDPKEDGVRKFLNFGHTLGHAIESYCLDHPNKETLLHGEAIAIGMILEAYLSVSLCGLSTNELEDIKTNILKIFPAVEFNKDDISNIISLLKHDKKNTHGRVNFVLLNAIGSCQMDVESSEDLIFKAFDYYKQ